MEKVVVIGRNYTSRLGMIRAVGRTGHQVYVVCTNKKANSGFDKESRYVSGYYTAHQPNRNDLLKTLFTISDKERGKIILIPVDDYAASTIDDNIDKLKDRFLFPNAGMRQGAVNQLMDKEFQKNLARKAGLKVAEGWTIEIRDHQYKLPESIKYPCFPKPQISFLGNKKCMVKCSTEQELRKVLDELAKKNDCPVLIEQYIEIEKEYGVLGFCYEGNSILPGLVEKILIGEGGHKGVTKVGVVTPLDCKPDLKKGLERLLLSTQLTGLCDIDLYESNGTIYFNELNLRFGAFGYSILCAGANLPECLIRYLTGEDIDFNSIAVQPRTVCISEKVNYDDYQAGYYNFSEYRRIAQLADKTFLQDKNDPAPYRAFMKGVRIGVVKRLIKNIIKRK